MKNFEDRNKVDRTLVSKKQLMNKIKEKTIQQQIEEL